jgi:hypothetical protein
MLSGARACMTPWLRVMKAADLVLVEERCSRLHIDLYKRCSR